MYVDSEDKLCEKFCNVWGNNSPMEGLSSQEKPNNSGLKMEIKWKYLKEWQHNITLLPTNGNGSTVCR
jgi:hypothetical protein